MIDRGPKKHLRLLLLAVLLAVFLLPEAGALAIPGDSQPADRISPQTDRPLFARRRRRRRYPRRRRRRRPKPRKVQPRKAPEPAPAPAASGEPDQPSPQVDPGNLRRGGRVEFDGRLVQGQTAKSGAIYLFARKRSELRSMVQERSEYRKEILRTVYPSWEKKQK